ncbi:amidohydrolase [Kribbella sp. NBC_01505]|uniref:amidohydrolase family protein n=1 Tax=Kribbella sp. NBC_01505 TaxID=2903580 RepID=UPI0038692207
MTVYTHFLPPEYVAAAERAGHLRPDGLPGWPTYQLPDDAVLSIPSPGVHFGDDFRAQVLSRRVNELAAELCRDHPGRTFLASLPLPDVDAALAELDYAYDVLHADGVILLSNVTGLYPGEPSWEPLWRALDQRSAHVLLHPTSPPQWRQVALDRPRQLIEFPFDIARAVTDLTLTGVLTRHPEIHFTISHGDLLDCLADRIEESSHWKTFTHTDCCR